MTDQNHQEALRELTAALTELTEIVTSIDNGFINPDRWERIAQRLEKTRGHLNQADQRSA